MRLPLWMKPETPEEFRRRMDDLERFMDGLGRKAPSEVAGDTFEPVYYSMRVAEAVKAGDQPGVREAIERMLRSAPNEWMTRLMAAVAYRRIGDEPAAFAQLGIGIALDPGNAVLHRHMAQGLVRRGEREAARAVLEKGWEHHRKHVARGTLDEERQRYFAALEEVGSA